MWVWPVQVGGGGIPSSFLDVPTAEKKKHVYTGQIRNKKSRNKKFEGPDPGFYSLF